MKRFLFLLMVLIASLTSFSQGGEIRATRVIADRVMRPPTDSTNSSPQGSVVTHGGRPYYKDTWFKPFMIASDTSLLAQANEGLSRSGGFTQLGQRYGTAGNPAALTETREIPLADDTLTLSSNGGSGLGTGSRIHFITHNWSNPSLFPYSKIVMSAKHYVGGLALYTDSTRAFMDVVQYWAQGTFMGSTGYDYRPTQNLQHIYMADMRSTTKYASVEVNGSSMTEFWADGHAVIAATGMKRVNVGAYGIPGQTLKVNGSGRFTDTLYLDKIIYISDTTGYDVLVRNRADSTVRRAAPGLFGGGGGGMTNPMSTTGDIIYSSDGSGTPARLGIGTEGQLLIANGDGEPEWVDVSTAVPGIGFGTDNQIPYTNSGGNGFDFNSGFTFDGTTLTVPVGSASTPGLYFNGNLAGIYSASSQQLNFAINGSERFRITGSIYRSSSGNIQLNGGTGAVTATTGTFSGDITAANILSGTYTPSLTNTTNVTSSTAAACQYIRVGNNVTVSGTVEITVTTGGSLNTVLEMTLPVASNLTSSIQCAGAAGTTTETAIVAGEATNNRAVIQFAPAASGSKNVWFQYTYQIL